MGPHLVCEGALRQCSVHAPCRAHRGYAARKLCPQLCLCAYPPRCILPYMPFHNADMLVWAAMAGADLRTAEVWAARLARFPAQFGPEYITDGEN